VGATVQIGVGPNFFGGKKRKRPPKILRQTLDPRENSLRSRGWVRGGKRTSEEGKVWGGYGERPYIFSVALKFASDCDIVEGIFHTKYYRNSEVTDVSEKSIQKSGGTSLQREIFAEIGKTFFKWKEGAAMTRGPKKSPMFWVERERGRSWVGYRKLAQSVSAKGFRKVRVNREKVRQKKTEKRQHRESTDGKVSYMVPERLNEMQISNSAIETGSWASEGQKKGDKGKR